MRRSSTWITNVKQGGEPWSVGRDPRMERLAIAAAHAVGATIAGVDILVAAEAGPTVLEVNSMPAWSGLQKVTEVNIAEAIAVEMMAAITTRAALEPAL
jgi:glutathione synthase/RimK-type ligase-like ATP-grasp enzyme